MERSKLGLSELKRRSALSLSSYSVPAFTPSPPSCGSVGAEILLSEDSNAATAKLRGGTMGCGLVFYLVLLLRAKTTHTVEIVNLILQVPLAAWHKAFVLGPKLLLPMGCVKLGN